MFVPQLVPLRARSRFVLASALVLRFWQCWSRLKLGAVKVSPRSLASCTRGMGVPKRVLFVGFRRVWALLR